MGTVREWCRSRRNRSLLAAVLVAFALRLAWAVWATQTPSGSFSDPAEYLRLAAGFADGRTPTIGSHATAFWPPGWPLAIAPLAWLSFKTGWISVTFAASLLNVVAGTATVAATAVLADRWLGPAARNPAAWLMALAPGAVYLTSTALSETWFTALFVVSLVLVTGAVRAERSTPTFVAIGALVGYAVLVRSPGIVLFAAPALVVRATNGSWRGALRPTGAVVAGAAVLLLPWMMRNGVQVGVWTPTSTNNAAFVCIGNRPDASGVQENDAVEAARCFRGSPFDDASLHAPGEVPAGITFTRPDEASWYPRTIREAVVWGLTHPLEQPGLILRKTYETMASDAAALSAAEDFDRQPLVSERTRGLLARTADLWYWATAALAALGLARVPACRKALPLWALPALSLVAVWTGLGLARYHQPVLPLMAALAGATIATIRAAAAADEASLPPEHA